MLGEENISTFPLQQIMKRFNTYSLYGKYANICGDLSAREIYNEGLFKQLTGGDMISAEIKHIQGHIKFRNTAKLINASNVMLYCSSCSKPVRVGFRYADDGSKERYCKSCSSTVSTISPPKTKYAKK